MTNDDLQWIYKVANHMYFNNALPDLPVRFARMRALGVTKVEHKKPCTPHYIRINEKLRWSRALCVGTVLHEMCHVERPVFKGHQPWHDRRMLQLAKAGALNGIW
jgi:hypothetical protein